MLQQQDQEGASGGAWRIQAQTSMVLLSFMSHTECAPSSSNEVQWGAAVFLPRIVHWRLGVPIFIFIFLFANWESNSEFHTCLASLIQLSCNPSLRVHYFYWELVIDILCLHKHQYRNSRIPEGTQLFTVNYIVCTNSLGKLIQEV
jgi:hypothetical protein